MPHIRGVVVCVDYDDLLAITLVRNMRHLDECVVVTAPHDVRTQDLCKSIPNVRCSITDAFYRHDAKFNKGLAIEEAGFDILGRSGWILIWDADTLFPDTLTLPTLNKGTLYGARRLILENPQQWHPEFNWQKATLADDNGIYGYFQLFHADDPAIQKRPWYDVTFSHAGGCDGYFQDRWDQTRKFWLNCRVLHLGPRYRNWFGRAFPRIDGVVVEGQQTNAAIMQKYCNYKCWSGANANVAQFDEHVQVPGVLPSGFVVGSGNHSKNFKTAVQSPLELISSMQQHLLEGNRNDRARRN